MKKKKSLSPEDKLLKAIFGKTKKEIEQEEEKKIEDFIKKVDAMSDEEFEKEFGYTREHERQHTNKMMEDIHWYDCIFKYLLDNGRTSKPQFSLKEVAELVKHFYHKGRQHQAESLGFDFNGNEVPEAESWEKRKEGEGK